MDGDFSAVITLNNYFQKIYVINLSRRADRWMNVERQCKKFGITVDRFAAYDGVLGADGKVSGNAGCTSSHRAVLELIAHARIERALVLEDDFEIVDEAFLEMFDSMIRDVPEDWDFLFLGAGYAEDPIARVNGSVIRASRLLTTSSYGITWRMARKMAPYISGVGPIDSLYGGWQREAKTYILSPRLMVQAPGMSDLTGQHSINSNSMLDTFHENLV